MSKTILKTILLLSTIFAPLPALAISEQSIVVPERKVAERTSLQQGAFTLAPMGFVRFCMTSAEECRGSASDPVELTLDRMAELHLVNDSINRRIRPQADAPGNDVWSLNVTAGDCDDYVVQKRHDLIARGWPAGALLFAAVQTRTGESHLVLVVRTMQGELVLDNLRSRIVEPQNTGYHWLKMQSAANLTYWVDVRQQPQLIALNRRGAAEQAGS